jgi:hypothetical protein
MYAFIDVWTRNLRTELDRGTAGLSIARSLDPLGWVAVNVYDCANEPVSFPAMPSRYDYRVDAVPTGMRLRAAAAGIRAEHALWRRFNDDTRLALAIPTYKNPRRLLELLAALDRGAAESRIDQLGGRLFRSLFPSRVTDARLSRILRENLPRVYPQSHSSISGRPSKFQEYSNVH